MMPLPSRNEGWWAAASLSLCAAAVLACFSDIRTYITGQDPTLYIKLARLILENPPGSDLFRHGMTLVAPGYTLLLASFMLPFGTAAAYWVNPVCLLLLLPVWLVFLRELSGNRLRAAVALPFLVFLLLGTPYPAAAHFLLFPFRGTSTYLLILLAAVLVLRGDHAGARPPRWLALAGLCLLLAVGIREVKLALVPPLFLWAALRRGRAVGWSRLFWLCLPFLVVVPAVLGLAFLSGTGLSNQAAYVVRMLGEAPPKDHVAEWMANMRMQVAYLSSSLGFPGLLCLLAGLWVYRRSWDIWAGVVLPALVLFGVYGLFLAHPRYTLSTLVLVSPVLALGAAELVARLASAVERRWGARAAAWPVLLALLVPTGMVAANLQGLKPMGPKVSGRELRRAGTDLRSFTLPGDVALVEGHCPYLVDFLQVFTDQPFTASVLSPLPVSARRLLYFRPLNDESLYTRDRLPSRLFAHHLPAGGHDLVPLRQPDGTPRIFSLGRTRYAVEEVWPWLSPVRVFSRIDLSATPGSVLWLDFQNRTGCDSARVRVLDAAGVEQLVVDTPGTGLVAVPVPPMSRRSTVRVESRDPLPAEVLDLVVRADRPLQRDLNYSHRVSVAEAFDPPPGQWFRGVGPARRSLALRLPVVAGAPEGSQLQVRIHVQAKGPVDFSGRWSVDQNGGVMDSGWITHSGEGVFDFLIALDAGLAARQATLRLDVPDLHRHAAQPRLRWVSYTVTPPY